jgi:signal transduction histidine kinase
MAPQRWLSRLAPLLQLTGSAAHRTLSTAVTAQRHEYKMKSSLALLCQIVWLLLTPAMAQSVVPSGLPPVITPSAVDVLVADRLFPPPASEAWSRVSLPDNWVHRGFNPPRLPVWYRLELEVPADFDRHGAWAVYLPYLYDGGQLFLNEKRVAGITEGSAETRVKWERPHLLALPYGAAYGNGLNAGRNVLHLRLNAPKVGVSLKVPQIQMGPAQVLQAVYEQRLFSIRTVAQFTSAACFATAAFVLFIWWRRRAEVLYGIFGLTALLWGVRTLTFVIEQLPSAQWDAWRLVYQSATGGFVVMMGLFTLRTAEIYRPKLERVLMVYALIGPLVLVLGGNGSEAWLSSVWTGGFFFVALLIIVMVCMAAWRQRTITAVALMVSVMVAVIAAGHDYFLLVSAPWFARLAPDWVAARMFVLAYAANAVLLVMGSILASRFINALRDLEALNLSLDRRVAEREAVIEQNYQRLVDLEGQRQGAEERQRIMQDMHDGLGAQLFSSLSRAERADMSQQEMSDALRGCIAEMRLAIDSLSTSEDDFAATFSDFRYRWEPQLAALGIASEWHIDIAHDLPKVAPHHTLQVLRVLQEALTNVLKHSRARQVKVRLTSSSTRLTAAIEDDGIGVQGAPSSSGRGLQNMRTRAGRLGGTVTLESSAGKTVLSLSVPTVVSA